MTWQFRNILINKYHQEFRFLDEQDVQCLLDQWLGDMQQVDYNKDKVEKSAHNALYRLAIKTGWQEIGNGRWERYASVYDPSLPDSLKGHGHG